MPPRRIIFYIFVSLFSLGLSAQPTTIDDSQPEGTFSPEYVFSNLDFSDLQTGLLADKALPLADLSQFTGLGNNVPESPITPEFSYYTPC